MNLQYVRSYLTEKGDKISQEDITNLIAEIDGYLGVNKQFDDIASIMRTVHEYNMSFLTQIQEYEVLPKEEIKTLPKRVEKARGILCTLSTLHTYLVLSRSKIAESTYNMKNVRSYVSELDAKKEHYKSEKMAWMTILKSLTQEMAFVSEMRRLDIEDRVGYIK